VSEEEIAALQDQLAEAQAELDRLQTIAADREARAAQLQEDLAAAQQERDRLSAEAAEAQTQLAARDADLSGTRTEVESLQASLHTAAEKYRQAVLASQPEVPPDLVAGETVEQVDEQLQAALRVVDQMRSHLESQAQAVRVPTGAPPRRPPDLSALSPGEKILYGLSRQQGT
jgi:chromosome segregation ATPase